MTPVTVDAQPIQDADGNLIGVTDISIRQIDNQTNGVEQQYDPNQPQEQQLTLPYGYPNEYYGVGVSWADGSQYQATVPDYGSGAYVPVSGPNQ
ncbi:MAG TPA: hypothetical protein VGO93_01700 [Candidatus Xenobia bacterium]